MAVDPAFQAKVWPLLKQAFTQLAYITNGRMYFSVAPSIPTLPVIVYQSQDLGGKRKDTVGNNGWQGLVTFRAIAVTSDEADQLLITLSEALPSVTIAGYSLTIQAETSIPFFPIEKTSVGNIYTAVLITNIILTKDS